MNRKLLQSLPDPGRLTRNQILSLLFSKEYGFLPEPPVFVAAEEEAVDENFCAGKAVLKKLRLRLATANGIFAFPVSFLYPAGEKAPVPCFIHLDFSEIIPNCGFPAEEILDGGCAVLHFCYQDVTSDDGDFTNGLAGLFYPEGKRAEKQCGKLGIWAWAASRIMDYAVTVPFLDRRRIGVVGHSRLGKAALLAGAADERFFCAFSNDSGCSGAALARGTRGETVGDIYEKFPYWFCEAYGAYAEKEESMPFDQHFLLAAMAPRRVYVASAASDCWADPENEYLSCVAAGEYYCRMGLEGFVHPDRMPVPGDCFGEGEIGYHLRAGTHYLSREDWGYFMRFIKK
ncbi:MAG TPA: alpha/beta hydrolase [Candidatus Eisenbergiella merdavium]|uniref:Alpha/beta hydrolase n=1 Tax=Candidatus Eisenbergiella merdavium TaxID=2838551 RepID=A0A9D2SPU8_9FIRM|nr:alpha/beta hydrolase [Candidatus Eisenbergiella merdavium]